MAENNLNADRRELAKFSELAHRWWDPGSEFKPLHDINPLRLNWIAENCGGLTGKRVLDIGCGGGILAESMAICGARVTGIDLSTGMLRQAERAVRAAGLGNVDLRRDGCLRRHADGTRAQHGYP